MNIGMLWFDNDNKTDVTSRVARAADYYHDKYGKAPTLCFVHPSMVDEQPETNGKKKKVKAGNIELRTSNEMLPNHFWIGVNGRK